MSDVPYNFVPLSPTIVTPEWGNQVSHTRPFPDGISGCIRYMLTALTPILVGGERQGDAPTSVEFYCEKNKPTIPGSSLRGMMRNVLEIATFSRMSLVEDQRNSLRDLAHDYYKKQLTQGAMGGYKANAKGGWLSFDAKTAQWQITPCEYARVEQSDLRRYNNNSWCSGAPPCSAEQKYQKWTKPLAIWFDPQPEAAHPHSCGKLVYRKASNLGNGTTAGTLVFTGQAGRKHMEFIFFVNGPSAAPFSIPPKIMRDFRQIHEPNSERGYKGEEWLYWENKPKIPVFYLTDTTTGHITSFGLAQMYKLPYTHSTHELIAHTTTGHLDPEGKPDFVQLLFGQDSRFKGRVDFLPAVLQGTPHWAPTVQGVLAAPKSSYYPHYIKQTQENKTKLRTAMDKEAEISGWKRYPSRNSTQPLPVPIPVNLKVQTRLKPLAKDSVFEGKVIFHNLKPEELGGLLWALTWGNDDKLSHSLGMAKAYGYGQIRIQLEPFEQQVITPNNPKQPRLKDHEYMNCFTSYMKQSVDNWKPTIEKLCGMANPQLETQFKGKLRHMEIQGPQGNEFVKNRRNSLTSYPSHKVKNPNA